MKFVLSTVFLQVFTTFHADAAETATVACGGGIPNKKCPFEPTVVSKTATYAGRCCSETPFFRSELKADRGCTVYAGTGTNIDSPGLTLTGSGLYCPYTLTFAEAELYCSNLGARLCTEEELAAKCAKSTGCKLNE